LSAATVIRRGGRPATKLSEASRSPVPMAGTTQAVHDEPVPILHQHFAEIRELRFVAPRLLKQPAVGIGRGPMRLIRAPLPVEIHGGIAGIIGRLTTARCPLKTLLAHPRFEQRAIDREVLVGQESSLAGLRDDVFEKRAGDIAIKNRSRFLVKVVGVQISSSMSRPTNQRNSRLYCSCSISGRSLRTE
jgi:hypothetical protein